MSLLFKRCVIENNCPTNDPVGTGIFQILDQDPEVMKYSYTDRAIKTFSVSRKTEEDSYSIKDYDSSILVQFIEEGPMYWNTPETHFLNSHKMTVLENPWMYLPPALLWIRTETAMLAAQSFLCMELFGISNQQHQIIFSKKHPGLLNSLSMYFTLHQEAYFSSGTSKLLPKATRSLMICAGIECLRLSQTKPGNQLPRPHLSKTQLLELNIDIPDGDDEDEYDELEKLTISKLTGRKSLYSHPSILGLETRCFLCDNVFDSKGTVKVHQKNQCSIALDFYKKSYIQCTDCNMIFTKIHEMEVHYMTFCKKNLSKLCQVCGQNPCICQINSEKVWNLISEMLYKNKSGCEWLKDSPEILSLLIEADSSQIIDLDEKTPLTLIKQDIDTPKSLEWDVFTNTLKFPNILKTNDWDSYTIFINEQSYELSDIISQLKTVRKIDYHCNTETGPMMTSEDRAHWQICDTAPPTPAHVNTKKQKQAEALISLFSVSHQESQIGSQALIDAQEADKKLSTLLQLANDENSLIKLSQTLGISEKNIELKITHLSMATKNLILNAICRGADPKQFKNNHYEQSEVSSVMDKQEDFQGFDDDAFNMFSFGQMGSKLTSNPIFGKGPIKSHGFSKRIDMDKVGENCENINVIMSHTC